MTTESNQNASPSDEECWGYQMIIDCFGCSEEICCDLDNGYEFLDKITLHLEMTKQTQPYIFKTCETRYPGRPGYSGWIPIIESGIQIHTSAYNRFISIDVYSCKRFDEAQVVEFINKWFAPAQVETCFLRRGKDYLRKRFTSSRGERVEAAAE